MGETRAITILMADDDPDDRMMAKAALEQSRLANNFRTVADGEELLDYLNHRGKFADTAEAPLPGVILLDLNMPKVSGLEALTEIKSDPRFKHIPVVVLTTSRSDEDIFRSYDIGANSFISKPVTFGGLVDAMSAIGRYWFEIVELPVPDGPPD